MARSPFRLCFEALCVEFSRAIAVTVPDREPQFMSQRMIPLTYTAVWKRSVTLHRVVYNSRQHGSRSLLGFFFRLK